MNFLEYSLAKILMIGFCKKKLDCLFYEVENKRVKMIRHETNAVNDWLESFCDLTKIFSSDDNQKLIDQNFSDQETISF